MCGEAALGWAAPCWVRWAGSATGFWPARVGWVGLRGWLVRLAFKFKLKGTLQFKFHQIYTIKINPNKINSTNLNKQFWEQIPNNSKCFILTILSLFILG
jgi:hypothetical protein